MTPRRMDRLMTGIVLWLSCLLAPASTTLACAGDTPSQPTMTMNEVTRGMLLFETTEAGRFVPAPTQQTDVSMTVTGPIVRATVTQRFTNPTSSWLEGLYVFPLPEQAAVDHLRMRIGDRVIEGKIKERGEARRSYDHAKREGMRAALIEQERPNAFTTDVANIGPGDSVEVELEYQETLHPDRGTFRLRFPMVVGPRYIPGLPLLTSSETTPATAQPPGLGWARNTDQVPDASRITPPVLHPSRGAINPVRVTIDLDPGFPVDRIESTSHPIRSHRDDRQRWHASLAEGPVPADRDFELVWRPAPTASASAAVYVEPGQDAAYGLLLLTPPAGDAVEAPAPPRELIFVIDTSGSMHGGSLTQAQAAVRLALSRLTPQDRVNVIQFNSVTHRLFPQARAATPETVSRAVDYVARLQATGGTEMLPALALALDGAPPRQLLRQIIFLTDGQAGNETELLQLIRERLGASRLFTVGIGSAPNSYFMQQAAEFGRGSFSVIGKLDQVQERMEGLFRKLEHPVLTDLVIESQGWNGAEFFPSTIPDLYDGESIVLAVRAPELPQALTLAGRQNGTPWRTELSWSVAESRRGLSVFWARQKIRELSEQLGQGRDEEALRTTIRDVALRHHLVSRFTSLVAVDVTPVRPAAHPLHTGAVPVNLPHGQHYEHIFGLPQTATAAPLHVALGCLCLLLAAGIARWRRQYA